MELFVVAPKSAIEFRLSVAVMSAKATPLATGVMVSCDPVSVAVNTLASVTPFLLDLDAVEGSGKALLGEDDWDTDITETSEL